MRTSIVRTSLHRRGWRRSASLAALLIAILIPVASASGARAAAPEGRGYEMVSPPDKNFGDITFGSSYFGDSIAAPNGEAASFCAAVSFAGAQSGSICSDYVSVRDAAGQRWETTPVLPPYCTIDNTDPNHAFFLHQQFQQGLSEDMRRVVSALPEGGGGCPFEQLDPFAPAPSLNVYMFEEIGAPSSGRLVTPEPGAPVGLSRLQTLAGRYEAGSKDLSHIVFRSDGQQTTEVPADGQSRLFEWANGTVRLLTRDTDNVPFATESALPGGGQLNISFDRFNAVSADGSRIFFMTPTSGDTELYMRENGTTTHHVSESECTSACGSTAADRLMYATPTGDKVVFRSAERLTDDPTPSGLNLYRYTHSDDPGGDQNLTLLTRDNEPADGTVTTPADNLSRIGVIGISDDGEDVYFVADGQLVAGEPTETTVSNRVKLYRWQANGGNPELSFIGFLSPSATDSSTWAGGTQPTPDRYVTPDGEHLLVQTTAPLDPVADQNAGVPHTDDSDFSDAEDGVDVYSWSEDDGWTCVSCPASGPNGGFLYVFSDRGSATQTLRPRRPINDDGSRVFFSSHLALVPRDTNGRRDVYMWEDGTLSLVSSGKSPAPSFWIGSSADGDDAFFVTRERLVGWDTDSNNDIYDARVGGGFPEPPPALVPCSGDECQNPPAGPPAAPGSGSSDFEGSGNVGGGGVKSSISGVRGLSASALATLARGGKARLRLKVNRAGRVVVVGRARVGKKRSRVLSSSAMARKAGSVSVLLALSRGARGELRRKGSLKVTLTVRFRDARPKVLALTVKPATSKRGRRS